MSGLGTRSLKINKSCVTLTLIYSADYPISMKNPSVLLLREARVEEAFFSKIFTDNHTSLEWVWGHIDSKEVHLRREQIQILKFTYSWFQFGEALPSSQ